MGRRVPFDTVQAAHGPAAANVPARWRHRASLVAWRRYTREATHPGRRRAGIQGLANFGPFAALPSHATSPFDDDGDHLGNGPDVRV